LKRVPGQVEDRDTGTVARAGLSTIDRRPEIGRTVRTLDSEASCSLTDRRRPMLTPGQTAPDFSLPDQHGEIVRLSDLSGRWVLLWWYPKAATPG